MKALAELLNAKRGEIPAPSQLIWARADVFGLFSNNVGSFSLNLVLTARCSHLMWSETTDLFALTDASNRGPSS